CSCYATNHNKVQQIIFFFSRNVGVLLRAKFLVLTSTNTASYLKKMKKGTLFIIVVLFANNVAAQESIFESINLNVLEQLIELAKQNYPERKIVNRDQAQAKSRLSAARVAHIDVLNVSYFYRPNRRVADPENPFFFAGVQVGLQLSPGQIVRRAFLAKEAKAAYEVAQLKSQAYEVVLENE